MYRPLRRSALRGGLVLALTTGVVLAGAAPAFAHVTAQPGTAVKGGYTVINFRVPNESDTASTVKLEVTLPTDHPITSARTTPTAGWTATITKGALPAPIQRNDTTITQAVTTVSWVAQPGTKIAPGQYLDFPLSVGPLPSDTDKLVLPAIQTYDDGKVVAWNETSTPGAAEPQHPAPSVTLTAATSTDGHGAHGEGTDEATTASTDTTARWLGGAGLLLGALGLGLGGGAALRGRKQKQDGSDSEKVKTP